jgi:hypothetical protein
MGSTDGSVYLFDPILRGKSDVRKFNADHRSKTTKTRCVELLKWIEPTPNMKGPNQFILVFDDGVMYFYSKDLPLDEKVDQDKEVIKIDSDYSTTRGSIMKKMQDFVETFNFDSFYKNKKANVHFSDST